MKFSSWVLTLIFTLGLVGFSGCFGASNTGKPLTEEQKKKIDDDMRKAIEKNKAQGS